MSWFGVKLNLKAPIRVFGDCEPNSFYFSRLKNGSILHGYGPALLQVEIQVLVNYNFKILSKKSIFSIQIKVNKVSKVI
jgi:hypothetical protein